MGVVSTRVHGDRSEPLSLNSHRPWVTSSLSTCTNQPSNQQLAASPYNCPPCCSLQSSPRSPICKQQPRANVHARHVNLNGHRDVNAWNVNVVHLHGPRNVNAQRYELRNDHDYHGVVCQVVLDGQRNLYVEQQQRHSINKCCPW